MAGQSDTSFWRMVFDAIRAAPPSQRRGLIFSPFPILVALLVSITDVFRGCWK